MLNQLEGAADIKYSSMFKWMPLSISGEWANLRRNESSLGAVFESPYKGSVSIALSKEEGCVHFDAYRFQLVESVTGALCEIVAFVYQYLRLKLVSLVAMVPLESGGYLRRAQEGSREVVLPTVWRCLQHRQPIWRRT